ncbi:Conserved_hypothetical protein [Hexamita inflata]|uniref:Uncharacterized protein n=1 Tax=Hexamita inflata TaxID=28002 RepID=A0ABP1IST7_9EUKA
MNFDEDNFVENQQKEDALFGALLDSVDLIDDIYGQYQNKISELDQQLLQLEKSIQVCEKMSLVKNQTIQKIDESLQRIQHSSQISQHLAKYQSQYELNSEMKAALSNPLNDKFDAHFDELMVVINEPNFPTLYQKYINSTEDRGAEFQLLTKAQKIIFDYFSAQLCESLDLKHLAKYSKQILFAKMLGHKINNNLYNNVQNIYNENLQTKVRQFQDYIDELNKANFIYAYPVNVIEMKKDVTEFNLFMPLFQPGTKRFQYDSGCVQLAQSKYFTDSYFGMQFDQYKLTEIYMNSVLFNHTHNDRDKFTDFVSQPVSLKISNLFSQKSCRISKQFFEQRYYPEHLLAFVIRKVGEFVTEQKTDYQNVFTMKLKVKFDPVYDGLKLTCLKLIEQFDFVGCCNFYAFTKQLMEEITDVELLRIIQTSQMHVGYKLLLLYKHIFASCSPSYAKEVDQQISHFALQLNEQQPELSSSDFSLFSAFRDCTDQIAKTLLPTSIALSFRAAHFLLTLKQLQNTSLSNLYQQSIRQFQVFVNETAPKLFGVTEINGLQLMYSFTVNCFGILNKILGDVADLDVYFQEMKGMGLEHVLAVLK